MDPVIFNLNVSRGSPISEQLNFVNDDDSPVDMAAYAPFIWQVRRFSGGPLLLGLTLNETHLDDGILTGSSTVNQTLALPTGTLQHDLLDASGIKWFTGEFTVGRNISEL